MTDVMKSNIIKAMTKKKGKKSFFLFSSSKNRPHLTSVSSLSNQEFSFIGGSVVLKTRENHWGPVKFVIHRSPGPVKGFREFLALNNKHISGTYLVTDIISPPPPTLFPNSVLYTEGWIGEGAQQWAWVWSSCL